VAALDLPPPGQDGRPDRGTASTAILQSSPPTTTSALVEQFVSIILAPAGLAATSHPSSCWLVDVQVTIRVGTTFVAAQSTEAEMTNQDNQSARRMQAAQQAAQSTMRHDRVSGTVTRVTNERAVPRALTHVHLNDQPPCIGSELNSADHSMDPLLRIGTSPHSALREDEPLHSEQRASSRLPAVMHPAPVAYIMSPHLITRTAGFGVDDWTVRQAASVGLEMPLVQPGVGRHSDAASLTLVQLIQYLHVVAHAHLSELLQALFDPGLNSGMLHTHSSLTLLLNNYAHFARYALFSSIPVPAVHIPPSEQADRYGAI